MNKFLIVLLVLNMNNAFANISISAQDLSNDQIFSAISLEANNNIRIKYTVSSTTEDIGECTFSDTSFVTTVKDTNLERVYIVDILADSSKSSMSPQIDCSTIGPTVYNDISQVTLTIINNSMI